MSSNSNIDTRIKLIMARIFEIDANQISERTRRRDLERWDSLSHLALLGALQEEFQIEIPPDLALEIDNFDDIKRAILSSQGTVSPG
jgi:acyl carrier protein